MSQLRKVIGAFESTQLDDELVMISAYTGKFFALRDIGLHIWQELDAHADIDEICRRLRDNYDVDETTCRASVQAFADQLVEAGFAEYV